MNRRQLSQRCRIEAVASLDNLFLAAEKARRGKSRRPDVEAWWINREVELLALRDELLSGSYQPGAYRFFELHRPKRRTIAAAPFRDRVVHHALCNLLAPVLERRFLARSFSCQTGKGTTAARECCRQLTNRHRHVLKCDVRKFFPNIDHAILLEKLARVLRCERVLALCARILASYRTGAEVPPPLFPGDDLIVTAERPRGLPIGNLTSQLWGNFFLDALDHRLAEHEGHGAYARYTDDVLIFGDDKARIWALREIVRAELAAVRLKLAEPKSRLLATREGVPFCGFRFLPGLRPRVLGETKRRFESCRAHLFHTKAPLTQMSAGIFAWYQFSREGNSEGLRRAYAGWPLAPRLKRRRGRTSRVLRGASWNNNDRGNLRSSNRNRNTPTNRNNNYGFRCVLGMSAPKAARPDKSARCGAGKAFPAGAKKPA